MSVGKGEEVESWGYFWQQLFSKSAGKKFLSNSLLPKANVYVRRNARSKTSYVRCKISVKLLITPATLHIIDCVSTLKLRSTYCSVHTQHVIMWFANKPLWTVVRLSVDTVNFVWNSNVDVITFVCSSSIIHAIPLVYNPYLHVVLSLSSADADPFLLLIVPILTWSFVCSPRVCSTQFLLFLTTVTVIILLFILFVLPLYNMFKSSKCSKIVSYYCCQITLRYCPSFYGFP